LKTATVCKVSVVASFWKYFS